MKTITLFAILLFNVFYFNSFALDNSTSKKDKIYIITTKYGDIKIKLYEKTILHKENFDKLVSENFYDSTLFHRIIPEFMIQGGDPESKNALKDAPLGNGGPGYTIAAEFFPEYIHKKGAIAAARMGDNVNPEKRSSGSQFYIVQGKVFTKEELDVLANNINNQLKRSYFMTFIDMPENQKYKSQIDSLQKARDMKALNDLGMKLQPIIDSAYVKENAPFSFTEEQIKIYTTIGGAPHLDGGYTVFGEVVEGMDVIDKIAAVERNKMDRPLDDIIISVKVAK